MSKKSFSKTGSKMLWIGWIIALVMLTFIFARVEESFFNPNSSPESTDNGKVREVILKQNRYSHYVSNGTINGKDVIFFLDTGASSVSIPEPVANDLGLQRGASYRALTANGSIIVYQTTLDTLTIGNIVLKNVDASINPHMDGVEILLGMSALKHIDFAQENKTLTLKQRY